MKTFINAIYVFSLTFTLYILFFSGIPQTSDEDLYLSATRSIVVTDEFDAPEVYGSTRLHGDYHGLEPAYPLLSSFWYRYVVIRLPTGRVQGLYLLSVLYTSISSGLLVILTAQLKYSARAGIVAGILFGVSTIAFPYAKSFYREILASFLILLTLVTFEETLRNSFPKMKALLMGINIFLLILILLTKVVLVFFVFPFMVMAILKTSDPRKLNTWIIFAGVAIILVILILIFTTLVDSHFERNYFYRYTTTFITDAFSTYKSIDHSHFSEAIFASLFSPWKGFFIYSPICIMIFPSLVKLDDKRQVYLAFVALITLAGLSVTQALAYDHEWWTISWGTRHLLPCVPLFIVASLPWIEKALRTFRSAGGISLFVFFVLGTWIQLGAVIFNPIDYNFLLFEKAQDVSADIMWNFAITPVLGQWRLLMHGVEPDLAIWRLFQDKKIASLVLVILVLCLMGLLSKLWIELYTRESVGNLNALLPSITLVIFTVVGFLNLYNKDSYYYLQSSPLMNVCSELKQRVTADDIVLIKPYRAKIWFYFMNADCVKYHWYSLPYNIEIRNDYEARNLVTRLLKEKASSAERIWLVNQVWSEPDELRNILKNDGYSLMESQNFSFESTKIIFDLYMKDDQ